MSQRTRKFRSDALRARQEHAGTTASQWWLRSPGSHPSLAATVTSGGRLSLVGAGVATLVGLRPAFWLNL